MLLSLRSGQELYKVDVPSGTVMEKTERRQCLIVPGATPADTATILPITKVLDAALSGLYGLTIHSRTTLSVIQ